MRSLSLAPAIAPAALALILSGCSWTPPSAPFAGPDPADPAASVRPVTDVSVRGAYESFRPVEPRAWRERNEQVGPQARP